MSLRNLLYGNDLRAILLLSRRAIPMQLSRRKGGK